MGRIYVVLTGGLGNQLFQIAAALSKDPSGEIVCISDIAKPRLNQNLEPDAFSFAWPPNVKISKMGKVSLPLRKSINLMIRFSAEFESLAYFQKILLLTVKSCATLMLRKSLGIKIRILLCEGVGYSSNLQEYGNFLIGYFQSHQNFEGTPEVKEIIQGLELISLDLEYRALVEQIEQLKPIVVHIRRGDYLQEKSIGLLSSQYFRSEVNYLQRLFPGSPVCAFSDQPEVLREMLSGIEFTQIDTSQLNSAQTLNLMSYGRAFVLSNSTFSWWAAYMAKESNCFVISPKPWFQNAREPKRLIPVQWKTSASQWTQKSINL